MVEVDLRMARLMVLPVAMMSIAGCKDGAPAAPSRNEHMTWERAEEIAKQYLVDDGRVPEGGGTLPYERVPRVKYLFNYGHVSVLVHRGEVFGKNEGAEALARYLREILEEDRKRLLAEDLNQLIGYFDAFPPIENRSPLAYYDGSPDHGLGPDHPAIRPRLEWSGDHGALRIYYNVTSARGNISDSFPRTMAEWTLTISSDGDGTWSERRQRYSLTEKRFVE